jgi:protein-tyrosine-phosphatase
LFASTTARAANGRSVRYQLCDKWEARSAGLEPGKLNPLVIEAMREAGIDISGKGH